MASAKNPTKGSSFWHEADPLIGDIHYADEILRARSKAPLVVFVHGVGATASNTWEHLPEWIAGHLDEPADIFNFSYPSLLWQEASIPKGAQKLGAGLEAKFPDKERIIFVTHSTGGLVVRRYLNLTREALANPATDNVYDVVNQSNAYLNSRWWKSVAIINYDVPHDGGNLLLTSLAYLPQGALVGPLLGMVGFWLNLGRGLLKKREYHIGFNQIYLQLHPWNPTLRKIRRDFEAYRQKLIANRFPVPHCLEILAQQGKVIKPVVRDTITKCGGRLDKEETNESFIIGPGDHFSVKLPVLNSADDVVIKTLAEAINLRISNAQGTEVSAGTFKEIITRQHARIDKLIGESAAAKDMGVSPENLSQTDIYVQINKDLRTDEQIKCIVTGPTGSGKSSILRCIARDTCIRVLRGVDANACIPVFFQLRDFMLSQSMTNTGKPVSPKRLMVDLGAQWLKFVNAVIDDQNVVVDGAWLRKCLRNGQVFLFVDSLDEFVVRHRGLSTGLMFEVMQQIDLLVGGTLKTVVGARDTLFNIRGHADTDATSHGFDQYRLALPEPELLCSEFPWMEPILEQAGSEAIYRVPLIAKLLRDMKSSELDPLNADRIYLNAKILDSLIESNEERGPDATPVDKDTQRLSLGIAARIIFDSLSQPLSEPVIRERMLELVNGARDSGGRAPAQSDPINKVESALKDDAFFDRFLNYTIFTPVTSSVNMMRAREKSWKIYHSEIENFLVAQFLSDTILAGYYDPLGTRANTTQIFKMAGDMLHARNFTIDPDFVNDILQRTLDTRNWFILGNMAVLSGVSEIQFGAGGAEEFFSVMALPPRDQDGAPMYDTRAAKQLADSDDDGMVAIGRLTSFMRWGRRADTARPADVAAGIIREYLLAPSGPISLPSFLRSDGTDAVAYSAFWCVLRVLDTGNGGSVTEKFEHRNLGSTEEDIAAGAALVSSVDSDRINDVQFLTLEVGFHRFIPLVLSGEYTDIIGLTIAVHYLYIVACSTKSNKSALNSVEQSQIPGFIVQLRAVCEENNGNGEERPEVADVRNYLIGVLANLETMFDA